MVLLAMRTRGQLDKYFQRFLGDLLATDGAEGAAVPMSRCSQMFLSRFHEISDFTFTASLWEKFAQAFCSDDDVGLFAQKFRKWKEKNLFAGSGIGSASGVPTAGGRAFDYVR